MAIKDIPIALIMAMIGVVIFLFTLGKIEGDKEFLDNDEANPFGGDEKKQWLLLKKEIKKQEFNDGMKFPRKKNGHG